MGYSNFKKISQVAKKFGLKARLTPLFDAVPLQPASDWLIKSLEIAYKAPATTEKAKSERLVSPILMEVVQWFEKNVTLFSGEEINISSTDDLSGPCDFFFGLYPLSPYMETPIISIAEAKDEDLEWGVAQCAAQLYAAHLLNEQEGKQIPVLYGCATDGVEWQFLKFEANVFYIEPKPVTDLPQILGTWRWIIQYFVDNYALID
ncbi:MAG: hypothetical protein RLZZ292_1625 [Bacteroidota bacterium]|jgi:hypothetical protein